MNTELGSERLELMKHVERIVRPVHAASRRKMRMRQELLLHLTELYAREHNPSGDPAGTLERAVRQLGPHDELSAELQTTVPRIERCEALLNAAIRQRPGETTLRYALRHSVSMAILSGIILIPFGMMWALGVVPDEDGPFSRATLSVLFVVNYFIGTLLFIFLGNGILCALSALRGWRAWGIAIMLAMLAGPLSILIAAALLIPITGNLSHLFLEQLFGEFPALWTLLIAAPAMLLLVTLIIRHERHQSAEWASLAIG